MAIPSHRKLRFFLTILVFTDLGMMGILSATIISIPFAKLHGIPPNPSNPPEQLEQDWNHTWGGVGNDYAFGVFANGSGNTYLAGYTASYGAGGDDAFLAHYAPDGNQLWNRTWGGAGGDYTYSIFADGNGNAYLAGWTASFGAGGYDAFLVKYAPDGTQQWNRTWGGTGGDYSRGVSTDNSGNVYLGGWTASFGAGAADAFVVKYAPDGTQLWNHTWGGTAADVANSLSVNGSGNAYIAGNTLSYGAGSYDVFLAKYAPDGTQLWNRTWGGTGPDYGYGVFVDGSENAYLAGNTSFGVGGGDAFLAKYTPDGTQLWNRTWGGLADDYTYGVFANSSGYAYIAGGTTSFGAGGGDAFLVLYAPDGAQLWNHTWGGGSDDYARSVSANGNGNVYIAGWTNSYGAGGGDAFFVKFVTVTSGPPPEGSLPDESIPPPIEFPPWLWILLIALIVVIVFAWISYKLYQKAREDHDQEAKQPEESETLDFG